MCWHQQRVYVPTLSGTPRAEGCNRLISCCLPPPLFLDMLVICAPCQPYTVASNKRFNVHPEKHSLFGTLYGDAGSCISMCRRLLPHRFISENVDGISKSFSRADPDTALDKFTEHLSNSVRREDGSQHFTGIAVIGLNATNFISQNRYRPPSPLLS